MNKHDATICKIKTDTKLNNNNVLQKNKIICYLNIILTLVFCAFLCLDSIQYNSLKNEVESLKINNTKMMSILNKIINNQNFLEDFDSFNLNYFNKVSVLFHKEQFEIEISFNFKFRNVRLSSRTR